MLDRMDKKTTVSQNARAAALTNAAGILINSSFIVNLPEEQEEDILATIDFISRTKIYTTHPNDNKGAPTTQQPNIAVIGAGYWGKNLLRNFYELVAVKTICNVNHNLGKQPYFKASIK